MKSVKLSTLAALILVLTNMAPTRSNAAVGLLISAITDNQNTKSMGYVLAAMGGLTSLVGLSAGPEVPNCRGDGFVNCSCSGNTCQATVNPAPGSHSGTFSPSASENPQVVTIGLVILGTSASPEIQFQELNAADNAELGLSESERVAFNVERGKINLIAGSMLAYAKSEVAVGKSAQQITDESLSYWETEAKPALSDEAYSASRKVSKYYVMSWAAK